jgi:hypothetical protein
MKHLLAGVFALSIIVFSTASRAESQEKMIIALKTSDFELAQTDISQLSIGEAQTFETDGGKVIDVLRTANGVEIYVDGELLEMNFGDEGTQAQHAVTEHVKVICHDEEDCDRSVFVVEGDSHEPSDHILMHEDIEVSCKEDVEGVRCVEKVVWLTDGEDIDIDDLHETHENGKDHRVIVIKKQVEEQN